MPARSACVATILNYRRRSRSRSARFVLPIMGLSVALALIVGASLFGNAPSAAIKTLGTSAIRSVNVSAKISVTDGDTIRVAGQVVRLVGFNSPETYRAACAREQTLGDRATRRLEQLVAAGNLDFARVRCSCPSGTEGTSECNYGRACGTLRANGKDVGAVLISEGLAVPFRCGATSCPELPRPWCG